MRTYWREIFSSIPFTCCVLQQGPEAQMVEEDYVLGRRFESLMRKRNIFFIMVSSLPKSLGLKPILLEKLEILTETKDLLNVFFIFYN